MKKLKVKLLDRVKFKKLNAICDKRGGVLLSNDKVINRRIKIKCAEGHIWNPTIYNVIKKGCWCSHLECVGKKINASKVGPIREAQVERLKSIIRRKGGACDDYNYVNNYTKINIKCKVGHHFEIRPETLFSGGWCPRCAGKYPKDEMLQRLQDHAASKGGRLLSDKYLDIKSKLLFQCGKGHPPWEVRPESILNGAWCPKCAPNGVKLDIIELKKEVDDIAKLKGGKCFSIIKNEKHGHGQYLASLECRAGHRWSGVVHHLKSGVWCPSCNSPGAKEKICRTLFGHITGKPFNKSRPAWLRNSRGGQMELDGYCEELQIAFEYQGDQHFNFIKFFHGNRSKFNRRRKDDIEKARLCRLHQILLLPINIDIPLESLQKHITDLIIEERPRLKTLLNYEAVDPSSIYVGKEAELDEIKEIAISHGGKCLSSNYISNNDKLKFICSNGHKWEAVPFSIKRGAWCKICGFKKISDTAHSKRDLSIPLKIIKENAGEYLGPGGGKKFTFRVRCHKGHEWITNLPRLKKGRWCQKCSARKRGNLLKSSIKDLQSLAATRGGELLSKYYDKSSTRYLWKCNKEDDHIWTARAYSIRNGSWCPVCSGKLSFRFTGSVKEFLRQEEVNYVSNLTPSKQNLVS